MLRHSFLILFLVFLIRINEAADDQVVLHISDNLTNYDSFNENSQIESFDDEISKKRKEQILSGLQSVSNLMTFLKLAKFSKALTLVGTIGGPIFAVSIVAVNIAFLFIKVESPEMKQLKEELNQLNQRLDYWSDEFQDIQRMIDWSAVQIHFGEYERSIRTMSDHLNAALNSPEDLQKEQREFFLTKYESNFLNIAESFYEALTSTNSIFSDNLFHAVQTYTDYHRHQVQQFMLGNVQLLVRAVQIQASYIHLKYNNTHANEFASSLWSQRFVTLEDFMTKIDTQTKSQWYRLSNRELDNFLIKYEGLNHKNFTEIVFNYYAKKFDWREWFILSYNPISGEENHALQSCNPVFRIQNRGRNIFLMSLDTEESSYEYNEKIQKTADKLLDTYESTPFNTNGESKQAMALYNSIYKKNTDKCRPYHGVAAISFKAEAGHKSKNGHLSWRKVSTEIKKGGSRTDFNVYLFY